MPTTGNRVNLVGALGTDWDPFQATRGNIIELSRNDVILSSCVSAWKQGVRTWEEAMTAAAYALSRRNGELFAKIVELESKQTFYNTQLGIPYDAQRTGAEDSGDQKADD